jgi:hypothetical protein
VFNYTDWAQLDQRALAWGDQLPADDGSLFTGRGTCLSFPRMAKQYATAPDERPFVEISNHSCLNSWFGGNIAARPLDVARFTYAAYSGGGALINGASLKQVGDLHCLSDGFLGGEIAYGLGIEAFCNGGSPVLGRACGHSYYGHGGLDYGSGAPVNGYFPDLRLGVSIAMNAAYDYGSGTCGKKCSVSYKHQPRAQDLVLSEALGVIAAAAGQSSDGCGSVSYDPPPLSQCVDAPSWGRLDGKPMTCTQILESASRSSKTPIGDLCDGWFSRYTLAMLQHVWAPSIHKVYTPPAGYDPKTTLAVDICRGTCMAHNAGPCWQHAKQEPWC